MVLCAPSSLMKVVLVGASGGTSGDIEGDVSPTGNDAADGGDVGVDGDGSKALLDNDEDDCERIGY